MPNATAIAIALPWWIRAHTPDGMRTDLVALGVQLGWVAPDEKEEPALATAMHRLRDQGDDILLVYDSAIDPAGLKLYLPRGGPTRVLITSNAHAWRGIASPIKIKLWPTKIGAQYLIFRTGRKAESAAAAALSHALGGLPLAHEQTAAYCDRLELPLSEYHRRFKDKTTRLGAQRPLPGTPIGQARTIGLTAARRPRLSSEAPARSLRGVLRSAQRRSCSSFPAPVRWPQHFARSSIAPTARPFALP
jgi:hypothetical protein